MTAQILFKFRSNFCGFSWSPSKASPLRAPSHANYIATYIYIGGGGGVISIRKLGGDNFHKKVGGVAKTGNAGHPTAIILGAA